MAKQPVNYEKRDGRKLESDVDYALASLSAYKQLIAQAGLEVEGLRVVELGPGTDFGAQLILASMGAKVTLADRYLAGWDSEYHPSFYRLLAKRWEGPKSCLEATIDTGEYAESLTLIEEAAENLVSVPDGSVDFVYSNAVFEHINDLEHVAREQARILRVGGWAVHQIDLRDHRNFSRPIEHLAISDRKFNKLAQASHYEVGNRYRTLEFWSHFESVGLQVMMRDVNAEAPASYRKNALARLRRSKSAYGSWPDDDVFRIGCRFFLVKRDEKEARILQERAIDTLAIIEALKKTTQASAEERSFLSRLFNWQKFGGKSEAPS